MRVIIVALLCVLTLLSVASRADGASDSELRELLVQQNFPPAPPISDADREYLRGVAKDTWTCIASLADEKTGLPYDNTDRGENTSVSNVGVYLTSVVAARDLGFITGEEAERRLSSTLASVERLKTWHGFQQCWNSIKTLAPADNDFAISLLDTGNLVAALMTVERGVPPLAPQCQKLLGAMEWKWFYDEQRGLLRGGFDTRKDAFAENWYLDALGTDARLCQFIAIANGAAPPEMWQKLKRDVEEKHGVRYLWPGWQGGGLFMQYISGLWLDERDTLMRRSAENFAYAQILHAREIGSPVWGWSACASPENEYLGWGKLTDDVVTPHACVLAVERFRREVVANLRTFESLGARKSGLGFVDSVNWRTKRVADKYLVLDQSMLLISLANYLDDRSVRRWFQDHPLTRAGRQRITDLREPMFRPAASK